MDCRNHTNQPLRKTSTRSVEWPITATSIFSWLSDSFFPPLVNKPRDCRNKTHLALALASTLGLGMGPLPYPRDACRFVLPFFDGPNRDLRHPQCVREWLGTIPRATRGFETAFRFLPPLDLTRDIARARSASTGVRHPPSSGKITRPILLDSRGPRPPSLPPN